MYEDKMLLCKDCGREFVFTAGEQAFYAEKGFANEPTRCKECRAKRKTNQPGNERTMFHAICAGCGRTCDVPFEPKGDKPVYCGECFEKRKRAQGFTGGSKGRK